MSNSGGIPVLLLKTESGNDGYKEYFQKDEVYIPAFVPVLEHRLHQNNLASFETKIRGGSFQNREDRVDETKPRYGGLVFTSQRAVEAFASVVRSLRAHDIPVEQLFDEKLPIYVVGPATARAIQALDIPSQVFGESSGNGEALADFILANHALPRKYPLLFLVGEDRRDIIPKTLQSKAISREKRIPIEELTVYTTDEMSSFAGEFLRELYSARQRSPKRQWIAVFSPTGCKAMLEGIGLLEPQDDIKAALGNDKRTTRIAVIGPTTQTYLQKEFGLEPDAVAKAPTPEGLSEAIEAVEQEQSSKGAKGFANRVMRGLSVSNRPRAGSKGEGPVSPSSPGKGVGYKPLSG